MREDVQMSKRKRRKYAAEQKADAVRMVDMPVGNALCVNVDETAFQLKFTVEGEG